MAMAVCSSLPSSSYCWRSLSSSHFSIRGEALGTQWSTRHDRSCRRLLKPLPKGAFTPARISSLVVQAGSGFGKRLEGKTTHKVLTLDINKAKSVETLTIFVRKTSLNGYSSKWDKVGKILLESIADVEVALRERRKKLNAAVRYQYPLLTILKPGQDLQYGVIKDSDPENLKDDLNEDMILVDVNGKEPEISVPAILRVEDGTKAQAPAKFY